MTASVATRQPATVVRPEAPVAQTPPMVASGQDALSDTVISGRIKAAILTDPAMAGSDVSVNGVMRVDSHLATTPQ